MYSKKIREGLGIPRGMHESEDAAGRYRIVKTLEAQFLLDFRHKKGRPWTPLDVYLVEPGGFEPPSASSPLSVLHA
ncbi:conserved protein of unknown function [Pseudomonas marincola]|uniref:Uncharacterized protein n=1 Tax=Pseudomonas marincola TaxID=437900 RepID=A0A653E4T0_9PSED|nr:conserved protein of unknown function [Pseudomonas marincola]